MMLRSLMQIESELFKLCHSKSWRKVKLLIKKSPMEAKPTSAAYRGIADTALVVAIRKSAPLDVITALVEADRDQLLKVRHYRNGNVLHEAIKHRASMDVVLYLIHAVLQWEKENTWLSRGELEPIVTDNASSVKQENNKTPVFEGRLGLLGKHTRVGSGSKSQGGQGKGLCGYKHGRGDHSYANHCTLFNQTDNVGRTPLHYMVDRFSRETIDCCTFMHVLQTLIEAFPPAVGKVDEDGLSPLDICIIAPKDTNSIKEMEVEMKVYNLAKMMIQAFPPAVKLSIHSAQTSLSSCMDILDTYHSQQTNNVLARSAPSSSSSSSVAAAVAAATTTETSISSTITGGDTNTSTTPTRTLLARRIHPQLHTNNLVQKARKILFMNSVDGNISHNTFSHALLYGRHLSTIELILETHHHDDHNHANQPLNNSWYTGQIMMDFDEIEVDTTASTTEQNEEFIQHNNTNAERTRSHSCMSIITKDFEVPLHIAITMRASYDVVSYVVKSGPDATAIPDRCGLTPLDWTWVRFVVDRIDRNVRENENDENENNNNNNNNNNNVNNNVISTQPRVKISKRRFIPNTYSDMESMLSERIASAVKELMAHASSPSSSPLSIRQFRHVNYNDVESRELWLKLSCLLPSAAKARSQILINDKSKNTDIFNHNQPSKSKTTMMMEWSPVHAASFLNCPRAVLLLAIYHCPHYVKQQDINGNLPIHYAASRRGYGSYYGSYAYYNKKTIPLGATSKPITWEEKSVVFDLLPLYIECTKVKNSFGQLPLHIAIEEEKQYRFDVDMSMNMNASLEQDDQNKNLYDQAISTTTSTSTSTATSTSTSTSTSPIRRKSKPITKEEIDKSPLMFLVKADIESLEIQDGKTNLYPFMQAAASIGPGGQGHGQGHGICSSLNMIYILLKYNPCLVKTNEVLN